jgi:hypothetical protein
MNMNLKKLLLIGMALVIAVFVAPASASASPEWADEGEPLGETAEVVANGGITISAFGIYIHCSVNANLALEAGSGTGQVTQLSYVTESCINKSFLQGCQLVGDQVTGLPLTLHATESTDVEITNFVFDAQFNSGCPVPGLVATFKSVTATPDNAEGISELTLSGNGTVGSLAAEIHGNLVLAEPGTYGIVH